MHPQTESVKQESLLISHCFQEPLRVHWSMGDAVREKHSSRNIRQSRGEEQVLQGIHRVQFHGSCLSGTPEVSHIYSPVNHRSVKLVQSMTSLQIWLYGNWSEAPRRPVDVESGPEPRFEQFGHHLLFLHDQRRRNRNFGDEKQRNQRHNFKICRFGGQQQPKKLTFRQNSTR